jgi:DNA-binding NarL/FixJ family response regulator
VLGERDDGDDVAQALAAGAAAALRRDARFEQIIACIEAVLCGRHVPLPPGLQAAQPAQAARLSPRELDILRHLSAGNSNKVIARHAGIGVGTVKYHVNNILSKLNVSCRTQAASVAIRRGLVHFTQ